MEFLNLEILTSQMLYIDPAATSALLSSITAILVALGASFIVIWRKLKKKVDRTFKIDPNKHKEVEDDLVVKDQEITLDEKEGSKENNQEPNNEANKDDKKEQDLANPKNNKG